MSYFAAGMLVVLFWWVTWTAYIQKLRRTGRFDTFHSGVYDGCTVGYAVLGVVLAAAGLMPFAVEQFRLGAPGLLLGLGCGVALWAAQAAYLAIRRRRGGSGGVSAAYRNHWPWALPVTGAAEEILFRGCLLFGLIAAGLPPWPAILLAAVVFGLVHIFQYGLYGVVLHSITGTAFGVLAVHAGLSAAIVAHAAFNMMVVATSLRGNRPAPLAHRRATDDARSVG